MDKPTPNLLANLNDKLYVSGVHNISLSAAKWSGKGNLILMANHGILQANLTAAAPNITTFIQSIITSSLPYEETIPPARANVKWSKILINSIPTHNPIAKAPWTPEECHHALYTHNPSYSPLTITQKPSWVCNPTLYKKGDCS
jgi:hypothetical protein